MTTTINNEHKKLNVPNLRFPEFQGEWEEHLLGNISDVTKLAGFEFTKYVTYEDNGNIIAIRGLNCKNGSLDLRDVKYIDNSDFSKLSRSKLYTGDILYTYVGTVGEVAVVDKNDKYYLAPNVSRIRLSKDYNSDFIKQLLGSKKFYNQIVFPLIATSSQPALSMENLRKFKLKVPSIREQTKIASLLNAIDERIATQNKIIEDLKKLKSAITDLLFHSIADAHTIRLGKIAHITNGAGDVQDANTEHQEDWYPFFDRSEELKWFPTYSFDKEAVIYAGEGQSFYPRYYNGKFALHQRCYAITDFASCIIPKYCYHFMNTLNSYFVRNSVGSTVPSLRMDIFQKVEIRLPLIPKQQHICKIIDAFYTKLEVEQRGISILQELKQFLLSQMFI